MLAGLSEKAGGLKTIGALRLLELLRPWCSNAYIFLEHCHFYRARSFFKMRSILGVFFDVRKFLIDIHNFPNFFLFFDFGVVALVN